MPAPRCGPVTKPASPGTGDAFRPGHLQSSGRAAEPAVSVNRSMPRGAVRTRVRGEAPGTVRVRESALAEDHEGGLDRSRLVEHRVQSARQGRRSLSAGVRSPLNRALAKENQEWRSLDRPLAAIRAHSGLACARAARSERLIPARPLDGRISNDGPVRSVPTGRRPSAACESGRGRPSGGLLGPHLPPSRRTDQGAKRDVRGPRRDAAARLDRADR